MEAWCESWMSAPHPSNGRVKVITRVLRCCCCSHFAQTPRLSWLWATWAQVMSPVPAPGTARPGGCPKAPGGAGFGLKMWVWRGSGCRFPPTVTKLVSSEGHSPPPVSHRQSLMTFHYPTRSLITFHHPTRSLITFHHPTCFSPIMCTAPEFICLCSSDITQSSSPESLPMQNPFFSFYWWN